MTGSSPAELRRRLAGLLARRAGLAPAAVSARAEAARDEEAFVDGAVRAFVDRGCYAHELLSARRVRLEDLDALPAGRELEDALDRRRGRSTDGLELVRLARLYALVGQPERAASCYREVLALRGVLPLGLAIRIAEVAAAGGDVALALAGVDRVAELILTSADPAQGAEPVPGGDPLRDDPFGAAALLERARDVALDVGYAARAVALGRAATTLYERLSRRPEALRSLAGQARALLGVGNPKKALLTAERWRDEALEAEAPGEEGRALEFLAERLAEDGQLREAAELLGEAVEVWRGVGDVPAALAAARARASYMQADGTLDMALRVLDDARAEAEEADLGGAILELQEAAVRVALRLGRPGDALARAEALRRACEAEPGREEAGAAAIVLMAAALVLAGDASRALRALGRVALALEDPAAVGRSLEVRAEVAAAAGRVGEARLLLVDAARSLLAGDATLAAAECLLRRGELAVEVDAAEEARADLGRAAELGLEGLSELRAELLQARLADRDEAELVLEELRDRAEVCPLPDRVRVACAAARFHLDGGDAAEAGQALAGVLEALLELREGLPGALAQQLPRSPLCGPVLEAVAALEGADPDAAALAAQLRAVAADG